MNNSQAYRLVASILASVSVSALLISVATAALA